MKLEEILKNQDIDALQKIIDEGMNIFNIRLLAILDLVKEPNLEFLQLLIENGVDIDSEGSIEDTKYMFSFIREALKNKEKLWTRPQGYNREWSTIVLNKLKKITYNFNDNAYMTRYRLGIYVIGSLKNEVREKKLSLEKIQNEYFTKEIYYRYSSLMFAIEKQDIKLVKFLIKNGADINLYDCFIGRTPLHYAIETKDSGLIKLLIENGADVNKVDYLRFNPLSLAINKNLDIEIIKFLINNGASLYPYSNLNFSSSKEKIFRGFYLESKWNADIIIHAPDDNSTILMRAIIKDHYELVKLLIKKGIYLDTQNKFGDTALIITSVQGNYDISKLLVDAGASIEIENSKGLNAIDVANDRIKEMLFKKVSNTYRNKPKEKKVRKRTKTKYLNSPTFRNKLNKKNINLQNSNGKTRLIKSCEDGNLDEIKECIEWNADIKDNEGYTALDYASFSNDFEKIRNILIDENSNHKPKELVDLLTNFTIDTPIKYSTHLWDFGSLENEYGDFQGFIDSINGQWKIIEEELEKLSPNLHQKIYNFLLSSEAKISWCSQIDIGWSSLEGLEAWCNAGNNPFDFKLDKEYEMEGTTITTFGEVIVLFKREIEVRNENNMLEEMFLREKQKLGRKFQVELINLKGKSFYTDIERFKNVIERIFDEMKKRQEFLNIEVKCINKNKDFMELQIVQIASEAGRNAKEMLDEVNDGDWKILKESLTNLCDWSIESSNEGKGYRVNYLQSSSTKEMEALNEVPKGFTHILRFYR